MAIVPLSSLLVAILGHLVIWVLLFNRLHATALPCRAVRKLEKVIILVTAFLAGELVVYFVLGGVDSTDQSMAGRLAAAYVIGCWLSAVYIVTVWIWRKVTQRMPAALVSNHTQRYDLAEQLAMLPVGHWSTRLFSRVPGNEIFQLIVNKKEIILPRMHAALDGFTITHLSDLHYSGRIGISYFQRVMDLAAELDSDLIAITGDLVEKDCFLDWLPETIGRLKAPYGVYYVLGNHDKRVQDVGALRRKLGELGMMHLGGRWHKLDVRGHQLLMAGNELPWFGQRAVSPEDCPAADLPLALKLALSHSPDQIGWARSSDFDLLLAGHTHGGQIRFPLIGPVVSPSHFGVKYASGLFDESPTLVHVSRGISGLQPLRFNCPPELTQLVLRCQA